MTLKDFVIEAVSRGRNTKRYIELSPDMDIWEWIDNLRKTGLEEEHTVDLFVEPVPGKIYVGRFSNDGEWFLKFIAGSMRLKVFFRHDGKFENIYSKKAKIASWTFRKDVGPCIAEINYWLPEMVKEAVSRGRSGYKSIELSPDITLDRLIVQLEKLGYKIVKRDSEWLEIPEKKTVWVFHEYNTGLSTLKLIAGDEPFKLSFDRKDNFICMFGIVEKPAGYDWNVIGFKSGMVKLSELLTEAVSSGRKETVTIEYSVGGLLRLVRDQRCD